MSRIANSRLATDEADFDFMRDLVRRARADGEKWALSWTEAMVDDELKRALACVVCDEGLNRLGFVLFRPPGAAWEITLVAVGLSSRGRGIFSKLLGGVEAEARRGRAALSAPINLEVRADNSSARQAYEKSGFRPIGRRKSYYGDGCDAILYSRG